MIRLLVLFAAIQLTVNLPVPDAKIYFPDDNVPIDPRGSYSQHPSQAGQRTYYTKTSTYRKTGGYQSPIQLPSAGEGSDHQYGNSGHHASYSSYGQHPHRLSYSSHSYGTGGSGHPSYTPGQSHTYESHSHSHGGSHSGGESLEGQIEQVSHGGSYGGSHSGSGSVGRIEQVSHGSSYGGGHSSGGSVGQIEQVSHGSSYGGSHSSGGSMGQIEQVSHGSSYEGSLSSGGSMGQIEHGSYGSHSGGGSAGLIEQESHGSSYHGAESHSGPKYDVHSWQETGNQGSQQSQTGGVAEEESQQSSYGGQHREEQISETRHVDEGRRPEVESSYGHHAAENDRVTYETKEEVKKPSAAETAAEEHHIIQQIEELAGITSFPGEVTKNPITQQQEIIREIKGLSDTNQEKNAVAKGTYEKHRESTIETGSSHGDHETTIPPVRHHEVKNDESGPGESQVHHREDVVETPAVKVTSDQGSLGVHHGSAGSGHHQVMHTETREETSHHSGSHKKSTPDPLDLMNIYEDYLHGDFKPGQPKEPAREPKKELKPEIKQAIENIMRDWEVLPDTEGKPQPPPRNFKVTKHVKVTTTTHNHPVVVQPSQTITKTVKTHTYQPSTSQHRVVTHHINIAELLEQLRQLESSPHHRNVTWCEEKIKQFLTELNRKEESGIEINQSVQEETLHHILTQDQTITKEVHHVIGHDASGGVEEEPFVKKTVVELGLNEPTKPPSYWEEQKTQHETNYSTDGNSEGEQKEETVVQESEPRELEYGNGETSGEPSREPDETHVIHVTPSTDNVPSLESLSHQKHTSTETKESVSEEKTEETNEITEHSPNGDNMEPHGSEAEGVTMPPVQPTPGRSESNVEEFRGEVEKHHRPLPPNYKPRERSEEETNESENSELDKGNEVETKKEHKRIDDLSIDLPENEFSHEEKEHKEPGTIETEHHSHERDEEEEKGGSYGHKEEEHIVHEEKRGEHTGGEKTEYVEETVHHSSEGGHGSGSQTEYTEETKKHHNSGGSHGHSGGSNTEYVEETVEHHNSGGGHSGGGTNTEYGEETVEHSSGGSHGHSGGSQTEYTEETVEHHHSGGSHEINYDQLIEELISLESLPGHQAIDKCEEKIRQFLEVLKHQQERGFDQNKVELERLRHLIEEMQAQRQTQINNGVTPNPEASASFWKKIGRKIKSTFEKAKTKAHDTVHGMMN